MKHNEFYMTRAFKLANMGRLTTSPNPNVGCVIVKDTEIVGEGYHLRSGELHAEIHALQMAGKKSQGATAYITLEPCSHYGYTPPCVNALITSGIKKVIVAMKDPNPKISGKGLYLLKKAGIKVFHGLMKIKGEKINKGFLKRMRTGLPYIQLKLASSLDGRIAMASGESKWITSFQSRQDVQRLRIESDAILSTSTTVIKDNSKLTVRWNNLDNNTQIFYSKKKLYQPQRIILDSKNLITPKHKIISQPGLIRLIRTQEDSNIWPNNVKKWFMPLDKNITNLIQIMKKIAKCKINFILVEAGSKLSGALINAKLVDELILYIAPKILGDTSKGLFHLPELNKLSNAPKFLFNEIKPIGSDLRLRLNIKY
ncbi:Riboflavin biosynthesis protein RibD [Serratia symbiotica]|nr:Riboflavin biosynthesis protein RibD [Serratia symbiotica]